MTDLPPAPPAYVMQITVRLVSEAECMALGRSIATLLARDSNLQCIPADAVTAEDPVVPEPTDEERAAAELVNSAEGRELAL